MTTPMTPDAALARLRQYGERTSTWSTATYNDGTEKVLHEIALTLAAEVQQWRATFGEKALPSALAEMNRLRGELSDATAELAENTRAMNALRRHRDTAESRVAAVKRLAEEADGKCNSTVDTDLLLDALGLNADAPSGARLTGLPVGLTGRARHDARVAMETARKTRRRAGACSTCGDVPDEWCPDFACCKAGCDGGRTNNPCTHPNAPWHTEPTP
ncbi:hypothetical protein ACIOYT_00790 [Streptomyces halstedii]|uniref:hypothetical protein n=1 Tax=Streptomyces halstedii TaxID=1944 RepID=UPI00381DC9A9